MSMNQTEFRAQIDGRSVTMAELIPLAFAGFAHFTAMQVRGGKVRGLDLHLARLRAASIELFGRAVPDDRLRSYLRAAVIGGPEAVSLTATIYSRAGEFTAAGMDEEPSVLIHTGPPSSGPAGPLRLAAVAHERAIPSIKHVGEVAKTFYLRQAVREGFDDAAFVDARGRLSEATIWNLAFWDGRNVIWPEAAMLNGITMSIICRQLERQGLPQRREPVTLAALENLSGAAVMNSWTPGIPVTTIGTVALPEATGFASILHEAYEAEPQTPL